MVYLYIYIYIYIHKYLSQVRLESILRSLEDEAVPDDAGRVSLPLPVAQDLIRKLSVNGDISDQFTHQHYQQRMPPPPPPPPPPAPRVPSEAMAPPPAQPPAKPPTEGSSLVRLSSVQY
jgi:hypothetical protein